MTAWKQGLNANGELLRSFYVEHVSGGLDCQAADDDQARQEFKDECDINVLMATYERNGSISHFNRANPQYLDVSDVPDLASALQYLGQAEAAFMSLPAVVRREFENDAVKFVEFAQDPANVSKMREWGLAAPEKPKEGTVPAPPLVPPGPAPEKAS